MVELISVIVPVYKVEKYLTSCVTSLMAQSYRNLEIILVDDGSPDRSGDLCDTLAAQDERIVVIHKPNGGLSDARNAGIETAKGDYLFFLDSDDTIHEETLEILWKNLKENQVDISVCSYLAYFEGKTSIRYCLNKVLKK
ncbi:glycosyltransferase [Carnobacterium viridans]|uniref:glycosyltransferase family 2 protein n=1 Tax=Carnobacterium viridans TaxID=174587 RepID=UPI001CFFD5F4|nr:glycosyltransferase family 2 protein [Carnobacterium viridans]UDE95155.1 glycosyltransferase [Carnobacterium viridans]